MTEFTTIILIMAFTFADLYIYILLERLRKERENEIVTGVVQGVPVSNQHRRMLLYFSWAVPVVMQIGIRLISIAVYWSIAQSVSAERPRFIALAFGFMGAVGGFTYLAFTPLWLTYFRSVLRQAEAD